MAQAIVAGHSRVDGRIWSEVRPQSVPDTTTLKVGD
jgi:hypothetical protein